MLPTIPPPPQPPKFFRKLSTVTDIANLQSPPQHLTGLSAADGGSLLHLSSGGIDQPIASIYDFSEKQLPPVPIEMIQPPPPPNPPEPSEADSRYENDGADAQLNDQLIPNSSSFATAAAQHIDEAEYYSNYISPWISVTATVSVIDTALDVGFWERHTKGIGGKLLERMGYIRGMGLGKTAQGRLDPVEAVSCSGLGQTSADADSSLPEDKTATETLDTNMKRSASVSVDSLYSSVQTKPQGSGGFKKKKVSSSGTATAKKKETVFDFLNKIPSSSGESCVIRKKEITQRKEIRKMTAKSAF